MIGQDAISLTIMNRRIHHLKRGTLNIARIDRNTIIRAVNIRVLEDIIVRRLINAYTLPLSRDIVVWQIVEHPIYAVAPQYNIGFGSTIANQPTEDINASIVVEINRCACSDGKRSPLFHNNSLIDY